jgi:hypothetical protein
MLPTHRLGKWSAIILITIGALYLLTGIIGASTTGAFWPPKQTAPYLAIMESLIVVSAPFMIILMSAIYLHASEEKKIFGLAAASFMIVAAGLTTLIQLLRLTVLRKENFEINSAFVRDLFLYSDLIAWDLFFGLSMFSGAYVFRHKNSAKLIFLAMVVSGGLCLVGFVGIATGYLQLQAAAILGYTVVFMIVCILLAKHFGKALSVEDENL